MTPKVITKKQFIAWLVAFTTGMTLWAAPGKLLWPFGCLLLGFSGLILMAPHERSRPLPIREALWIFGGVLMFATVMVALKWLLPNGLPPNDFGIQVARVIRHPVFVAILWALIAGINYRRWKATTAAEQKTA